MSLVDLVFPRYCMECRKVGNYICKACLQKVSRVREVCYWCGHHSVQGKTHSICKTKYGLDGLYSIWKYQGVIREAILGLKYKFASEVAKELASVVVSEVNPNLNLLNSTLTPIPVHKNRKRWRGFNQSEEIGKLVARELGWKYIADLLIKPKETVPQAQIKDKRVRMTNVKQAFLFNKAYQSKIKKIQPIVIFDDVWTTGSTVKQAVRVLKKNEISKVWGLTLAR